VSPPIDGGGVPPGALTEVWSWGGATHVRSWVRRPTTLDEVRAALAEAAAADVSVALRGAGQSYGDAALAAHGMSLDLSRMTRILAWDPAAGLIEAEPGVTIAQVWRRVIGDGWWPPVVPGTMAVSLGGGVAMNYHGKNNWRAGPIGDHVRDLDVLLPSGEVVRCSRDERDDLFRAVIGGYGMLGAIVRITLRLKRVHSGLLDVEAIAADSLASMLGCMEARRADADYLVGWVDTMAHGPATGRGLVHEARLLAPGDDPHPEETLRADAQELPSTIFGVLPKSLVWRLMRPFTNGPGVRLVNAVKYRQGVLTHGHRFRQSHAAFHFLLDYVPGWRRAYGPGGLIQFQSFVPAAEAESVFRAILDRARAAGLPPYLGVLKRHRPDEFLMTHAVDGWSLALDFPVRPARRAALWGLARDCARLVLDAGGRFYPAKDSTLDAETYQASVGADRLARFRALKAECDPTGLLETELSKRLLGPMRHSPSGGRLPAASNAIA
jgi:decaprenylphospho-beta-D-ribofuranose 2-oxidase